MSLVADLCTRRLVIVMGKGGVGRTTVAAALGTALARRGRRTLLYQASAKDRLAQLLDRPRVGESIVELDENLSAVNTNAGAALHEYGLMVLRYETIYRMVLENKLARSLLRAVPGLDDYAIVGKMWWHTTEEDATGPRWDTIVFDAPATGHAVNMLRIPRAILDAVPEGPLTRDAVKVQALLEDPQRTAVVLVVLAEEMPTAEAIELSGKLRELGLHVACLVVNQVYPDHFPPKSAAGRVLDAIGDASDDPLLSPILARAKLARARRALNERYLERLRAELALPEVHLPLLFAPSFGRAEIAELSSLLDHRSGCRAGSLPTRGMTP